ncbi:MAG TPA: hypothetical protein VGE96_02840 [Steroidobacteraceae bacterium]
MFMLGGSAVGGFALSQWLTEHERTMQNAQLESLQASLATMRSTENELKQVRADARDEIESALLRKQGMDGVVVMATVGPCKPPIMINTPALTATAGASTTQIPTQQPGAGSSGSTCNEAEASPVTLCASVPATAKVTDVEVYSRSADADTPWANARVVAGSEAEQARFSEKPVEVVDGSATKQVCETFATWSTERARVARVLVRYEL